LLLSSWHCDKWGLRGCRGKKVNNLTKKREGMLESLHYFNYIRQGMLGI